MVLVLAKLVCLGKQVRNNHDSLQEKVFPTTTDFNKAVNINPFTLYKSIF